MFTSLTSGARKEFEQTEVGISSLIDTWIFVRDVELNGERNRCIYVLKSRGMAHSNQVREFVMSDEGHSPAPGLYRRRDGAHRLGAIESGSARKGGEHCTTSRSAEEKPRCAGTAAAKLSRLKSRLCVQNSPMRKRESNGRCRRRVEREQNAGWRRIESEMSSIRRKENPSEASRRERLEKGNHES